jgi:polar amino acid transport system substrate-binding protein
MMRGQISRGAMIAAVLLLAVAMQPSFAVDDAAALAPKGELRVGLVTANSALVTRDVGGQFKGLAIDIADALAAKIGVTARVVPYDNQTRFNVSVGKDQWDVAIAPRDLSRSGQLAFSHVLVEADNGYVAKASASLAAAQDVDRPGIKVAVAQGSALDGYLSRTFKSATIVRVPAGVAAAREALSFGRADVYVDNTTLAYRVAAEVPGATVLVGRVNTTPFTLAVPKNNAATLPTLNSFVQEARKTGLIAGAIKTAGLRGVRPGPEPK